ncbi:MAG TPA: hypothetical protein VLT33_10930 [Labilithrix sp.]|nr:hypothetical protein [Labilithrix sp.]
MSQPEETAPPSPEQTAPQAADALVPEAPLPSGAPYRVPAPQVVEPAPESYGFRPPRKPRPMIGPALSVLGVALWAFVVMGQFTTSWMFGAPLGQGTAVFFIMLVTAVAWISAIRRSRVALAPRSSAHLAGRSVGIAVLSFLFFVVCLVAATAAGGMSSRGHDFLIAFALIIVSLVAALAGPRLTSPVPLPRTHRQRSILVGLWLAGVLVTLVAGADLAANG